MNKDEYLRWMKQEIDESIKEDQIIQQFLVWLHEKTASLCSPYQEGALRAFYCDVVEGITSAPYNFSDEEGVSVNRKISRLLDSNLDKDIDEARRVGSELSNDNITYNSSKLSTIERRHLRRLIYEAETLPAVNITFDKDVAIACKRPYSYEEYKHYEPPYPKHGYLDRAIALLVRSSDRGFQGQIKYIMNTFPDARKCGDYLYEKRLEEWRQRLSSCLSQRNLKLDWQFSDEQKQLLNKYYAANKLLVDLLQENHASPEVQKEIQDTLLLPIVEIQRRKSDINKKILLDCSHESNATLEVKENQEILLLPTVDIEKCRSNEVQQPIQNTLPLSTDKIAQHQQENKQSRPKLSVNTDYYTTTVLYSSLLIALILYIVFITVFKHYIWIL